MATATLSMASIFSSSTQNFSKAADIAKIDCRVNWFLVK
jgi:hypothetical protein